MKIEQFVAQSEGEWRSMRSGHSLAFKQFEQIISKITIKILNDDDPRVLELLTTKIKAKGNHISPFHISISQGCISQRFIFTLQSDYSTDFDMF